MRAFFIHFVVLTLAFAASASASGQTTMTLQDCMKYAISNSTKLRIQQAEAYNLNLKKLEQGLISPLEFNLSNNNYLKAQADEMSCLFKYLIKEAVVKYYNGVEYIDQ